MANRIQKQKGVLLGFSICALVLGLAAFIGGIILAITNGINLAKAIADSKAIGGPIALMILGIVLALGGGISCAWGVYTTWIGASIKATKGSIAEDNLSKGTVNGKVCPKCGCTNTVDATECTVCHTPLN